MREQPPAIIVLNAIGFVDDPKVPERINAFFDVAGPLLLAQETTFLATLAKQEDLVGEYAFDLLFSGELRDIEAFDIVHEAPSFLEAAQTLRNPSLRAFTEQSGRIALELGE
ncbi:MAG: hypothetical protein JKY37_02210 [Nannocystaceae bacterium]|nr:hypothetical protein [Nannocystaceae bacterium]